MKILITGAKGFLGSNLSKYLSKSGFEVWESTGDLREFHVADRNTVGADMVLNMSANMGGVGYFSEQNYYPPIDNFVIDLNILRACEKNKVKRLFYPASACAYPVSKMNKGDALTEPMLDLPAEPDQMYGWEKLTMVKLMRNSPLDCRVGILHTIYGEGQEYEGEKAKFPPQIAYKAILAQEIGQIEVWGDGTQTRTFLYVDDAIEKICEVMMKDEYHGAVNIGSDIEVSVNDIVTMCCDILRIKPKIKHDLAKPVGPSRRRCDNAKFNQYYKAREKTNLREGFARLINDIRSKMTLQPSKCGLR